MEIQIFDKIAAAVRNHQKAALVTITKIEGSTPRKTGSMMIVFEDGSIEGTVGGGKFEFVIIDQAKKCIEEKESKSFSYELNDEEGSLHMQCGGSAEVFIKVFAPTEKLLIVGGGHIALELYQLGQLLGYHTSIFEDREDFLNLDRFPKADELILGKIEDKLRTYPIDANCYIVIVTRGHKYDEIALEAVVNRGAAYIGMIGSRNKTEHVMTNLQEKGIGKEDLEKVYAPIGLKLGGETPMDIGFSILAEIQLIRYGGKLEHMKNRS